MGDKSLSEAYYLYDELSSKKGFSKEVATEYITESFERLNDIILKKQTEIEELSKWVDSVLEESVQNSYVDIDNVLYEKGIRNLEKIVESKLRIQTTLTETKLEKVVKESVNLPLSTMLKIASNTFNKEYENISESERDELYKLGPNHGCLRYIKNRCIDGISVEKRPIHCVDSARNKYLLRQNNDWIIDDNGKLLIKEAYEKIKNVYLVKLNNMDARNIEELNTKMKQLLTIESKGKIKILGMLNNMVLLKNTIQTSD